MFRSDTDCLVQPRRHWEDASCLISFMKWSKVWAHVWVPVPALASLFSNVFGAILVSGWLHLDDRFVMLI